MHTKKPSRSLATQSRRYPGRRTDRCTLTGLRPASERWCWADRLEPPILVDPLGRRCAASDREARSGRKIGRRTPSGREPPSEQPCDSAATQRRAHRSEPRGRQVRIAVRVGQCQLTPLLSRTPAIACVSTSTQQGCCPEVQPPPCGGSPGSPKDQLHGSSSHRIRYHQPPSGPTR